MSYSRWGSSCWYTYSDVTRINNEPTLTLMDHWSYPLSYLKENKQQVLSDIKKMNVERNPLNYKGTGLTPNHYTEEEVNELSDIIDIFLNEDHDFWDNLRNEK